jgi:magnesium transporter
MAPDERWTDLLDPTPEELQRHLPPSIHDLALQLLLEPARHGDEPRPKLESHGNYIFGVFLVPVAVPSENSVFYQQVDIVLTQDSLLAVRKTPAGREPYDCGAAPLVKPDESPARGLYRLVDDIAERFLDLIDAVNEEIDELEDHVDSWPSDRIHDSFSKLRHGLLHVRRTLAPTRDAVHTVVDNRVELEGAELFTHDLELSFADAYDKLLRAADGLELSRDLLAGVRDYRQAKVANDQNEVVKRLTAIASILLLPTFIVGLYGQNFLKMPEYHWGIWGYVWSWSLILGTTIVQVWYFRRKRWL